MLRMFFEEAGLVVLELVAVLDLRVREAGERLVELRVVRLRDAAVDVEEDELVLRRRVELVVDLARDRDRRERRAAGGWVEDPLDRELGPIAARGEDLEPRAELQVVVLREGLVGEGAVVRPERVERPLRAFLPVHLEDVARTGVDPGERVLAAEGARLAPADPDDVVYAGRLAQLVADRDRDQVEVVLGRHRVVGDPDLVHGAEERGADRDREHGHEGDEGDPDHQRARVRAGPLRVPGRVLAREDAGGAREPVARHAEHGGDRPDQLRGEERDADEHEHGADAHEEQHLAGAVRAEQPEGEQEEAEHREQRRAHRAELREAPGRDAWLLRARRRSAERASPAAPGAGWRSSSPGSRRPARRSPCAA